jgi:uncharacterized membrane protein
MEPRVDTTVPRIPLHPLNAILLSFPVALFTAAIATDVTFLKTSEIQWSNFSAWLNAGGLAFGGLALLWALVVAVRWRNFAGKRPLAHLVLLAAMWIVGFFNALLHSRDAWYSVTTGGALLSVLTSLLALASAWLAFSGFSREVRR